MAMLQLRLFGHMAVTDTRGQTYLPRTRKARALLAVLALSSPKPVLRQHLASLLWSRRGQEQARGSLRQSVHELQDTLGPAWDHLFVTDRHHLALRGPNLVVDALALAQPEAISADVLGRFAEVLLEDLGGLDPAFDQWLEEERARFQRIGRAIGESLLAKHGSPEAAIDVAERLLAIDRTHEGAWRTMIRLHGERGRLTAALACYERCRAALAEIKGVQPAPETEDLIGRLRAPPAGGREASHAGYGVGTAEAHAELPSPRPHASRERSALRLCVAPLRMIGVEVDDGLAQGLVEEILAGLARFRWISCVPANIWFGAQAGGGFPLAAGAAVEVDLMVDGTIQYGPGRVRIIVRLIDLRADGEIAWAGRFDRPLHDPLSLQDELGNAVVAQIEPALITYEGRRTAWGRPQEMTAQGLLLRALPAFYRLERDAYPDARHLLEASLRAEPASAVAHGWLAYWHWLNIGQGWAVDPVGEAVEAARLAERAVRLDALDALALTLAGHVRGFLAKRPDEACALHERAITLNPNLALAWCFFGLSHVCLGRHEEALRRVNQAVLLSPSDPNRFVFDAALIVPSLLAGDCAGAVEAGRRAVELNPLFSLSYQFYLAALGWMQRPLEAREVLDRLLGLEPDFSVEAAMLRLPLRRGEDVARYAEGLRRAGVRERGVAAAALPVLEHSVIDLVVEAPHSSPIMRIGSHRAGRAENDANR